MALAMTALIGCYNTVVTCSHGYHFSSTYSNLLSAATVACSVYVEQSVAATLLLLRIYLLTTVHIVLIKCTASVKI